MLINICLTLMPLFMAKRRMTRVSSIAAAAPQRTRREYRSDDSRGVVPQPAWPYRRQAVSLLPQHGLTGERQA